MTAKPILGAVLVLSLAGPGRADDARVEGAGAVRQGAAYTVSVTLRHGDTGWDDYADAWRVELSDGTVLGTRILVHPHEHEQPFTRSQGGIRIPPGTKRVWIRSRTTRTDWSEVRFPLDIAGR